MRSLSSPWYPIVKAFAVKCPDMNLTLPNRMSAQAFPVASPVEKQVHNRRCIVLPRRHHSSWDAHCYTTPHHTTTPRLMMYWCAKVQIAQSHPGPAPPLSQQRRGRHLRARIGMLGLNVNGSILLFATLWLLPFQKGVSIRLPYLPNKRLNGCG